jgi:IPT/TIG domain/Tyrosine-protein kinase ephrin type A/B receptor-like
MPQKYSQFLNALDNKLSLDASREDSSRTGFEESDTLTLLLSRGTSGSSDKFYDYFTMLVDAPCINGNYCGWNASTSQAISPCSTECSTSSVFTSFDFRVRQGCDAYSQCPSVTLGGGDIIYAGSSPDDIDTASCSNFLKCSFQFGSCCSASQSCLSLRSCIGVGDGYLVSAGGENRDNVAAGMYLPTPARSFCLEVSLRDLSDNIQTISLVSEYVDASGDKQHTRNHIPLRDFGTHFSICGRETCNEVCSLYTNCGDCQRNSDCGWCSSSNQCMPGTASGPMTAPQRQDSAATCTSGWLFGNACCAVCQQQSSCAGCTAIPGCGWCASTNQCLSGRATPCSSCNAWIPYTSADQCSAINLALPVQPTTTPDLLDPSHRMFVADFNDNSILSWTQFQYTDGKPTTAVAAWRAISQLANHYSPLGSTISPSYLTILATVQTSLDSFTVAIDLKSLSQGVHGVFFRSSSDRSMYQVRWGAAQDYSCSSTNRRGLTLERVSPASTESRTVTTLDTRTIGFAPGSSYDLRITVAEDISATYIYVFINGDMKLSTQDTDSARPTNGGFGILANYNADARFDNLHIYAHVHTVPQDRTSIRVPHHYWTHAKFDISTPPPALAFWRLSAQLEQNMPHNASSLIMYAQAASVVEFAYPSMSLSHVNDQVSTEDTSASSLGLMYSSGANSETTVSDANLFISVRSLSPHTDALAYLNTSVVPIILEPVPNINTQITTSTTLGVFAFVFDVASGYSTVDLYFSSNDGTPIQAYASENAIATDRSFKLTSTEFAGPSTRHIHLSSPSASKLYGVVFTNQPASDTTIVWNVTLPTPSITSVSPAVFATVGGSTITIDGNDFGDVVGTATIDGTPSPIASWTSSQIVCTVPPGQGSLVALVVSTPLEFGSSAPFFVHYAAPVITGISPANGPTSGQNVVTIIGSNFGTDPTLQAVEFLGFGNATLIPSPAIDRHHTMYATVPSGAGTAIPIIVYVAGHKTTADSSDLFSYDAPRIDAITPQPVPLKNHRVTINGANFAATGAGITVLVEAQRAGTSDWYPFTDVSHSHIQIVAVPPSGTAGSSVNVRVTVNGQAFSATSVRFAAPVITHVEPTEATTDSRTTITIYGNNFGSALLDSSITVAGLPCFVLPADSNDTIANSMRQCILPEAQLSGSTTVVLTVAGQSASRSNFAYVSPSISSVLPQGLSTSGGETVEIIGTSFGLVPDPTQVALYQSPVTFDSQPCLVTSWNHTQVSCALPSGQGVGAIVRLASGDRVFSAPLYTYGLPNITTVYATTYPIPVLGGVIVTIDGQNFGNSPDDVTVRLGEYASATLCPVEPAGFSSTRIRCTAPAGYGGPHIVNVTVLGQWNSKPNQPTLLYAPPTISSTTPLTGQAYSSPSNPSIISLQIEGKNFGIRSTANPSITVGTQQCSISVTTSYSDTSLTCLLAPSQGENLPISVTINGQTAMASDTFSFFPPVISTAYSPSSVSLGPAVTVVNVQGRDFGTGNVADFAMSVVPCIVVDNDEMSTAPPNGITALTPSSVVAPVSSWASVADIPLSDPIIGSSVLRAAATPSGQRSTAVVFTLSLAAQGSYAVAISLPRGSAQSETVTVRVQSGTQQSPQTHEIIISQSSSNDEDSIWRKLGVFYFSPSDVTQISGTVNSTVEVVQSSTGAVYVDAVRVCAFSNATSIPSTDVVFSYVEPAPTVTAQVPMPQTGVGSTNLIHFTVGARAARYNFDTYMSYPAPSIAAVYGCPSQTGAVTSQCDTGSSTQITIVGTGFGGTSTVAPYATRIFIGADSNAQVCLNVKVVNSTTLTCEMPARASGGFAVPVTVAVADQVTQQPYVSFAGAEFVAESIRSCGDSSSSSHLEISSVAAATCISFDMRTVSDDPEALRVWLGSSTVIRPSSLSNSLFTIDDTDTPTAFESGIWYPCPVSSTSVAGGIITLSCSAPPAMGQSLYLVVKSNQAWSPASPFVVSYPTARLVSNSIRLSPTPGPGSESLVSLLSSQGSLVVFDTVNITSNSTYLPLLSVKYRSLSQATSEMHTCGSVQVNAYTNGTYLQCRVGSGRSLNNVFYVYTLGEAVAPSPSTFAFGYPFDTPVVEQVKGCTSKPSINSNATYDCDTSGGTKITIQGQKFCVDGLCETTLLTVYVGTSVCSDVDVISTNKITCILPPGSGTGSASAVRILVSNGAVSEAVPLLSFAAPLVISVRGCATLSSQRRIVGCPQSGNVTITISGQYFGPSQASVRVGRYPCAHVQHGDGVSELTTDTALRCTLSAGYGVQLPITVFQFQGEPSTADQGAQQAGATVSFAQCTAGEYIDSSQTQAPFCSVCDAGTYSAGAGASVCTPCPAGWYSLAGQSSCSACIAGTFSVQQLNPSTGAIIAGATACTNCSAGYVSIGTGSAQCTACEPGRFTDTGALTYCEECKAGTYASGTASSSCDACPTGSVASSLGSRRCEPCTAGYFAAFDTTLQRHVCTECPAGSAQPLAGQTQCPPCDAGFFTGHSGQARCIPCGDGRMSNTTGRTSCYSCAKGYFAEITYSGERDQGTSTQCIPCVAGTYSSTVGQAQCQECQPGTYQPEAAKSTCLPCSTGRFSDVPGAITCTACEVGKYASTVGSRSCDTCTPGRYTKLPLSEQPTQSSDGTLRYPSYECTRCAPSTYQDNSGASSCLDCSAGTFSNVFESKSCTRCADGLIANVSGLSSCSRCPAGYSANAAAIACVACLPGRYASTAGLRKCIACELGRFSLQSASTICKRCEPGSIAGSDGSTSCSECLPGFFATGIGSVSCSSCSKGFVANASSATTCVACEPGKHQSSTGRSTCVSCAIGKFSSNLGSVECVDCLAGTFSNSTGLSRCHSCDRGYSQPDAGRSDCSLCAKGQFSTLKGAPTCQACPGGTISNVTGSTMCSLCAVGKASTGGASSCFQCTPGSYASDQGLLRCIECDKGRFASAAGSSGCTLCQSGKYAPNSNSIECASCPVGTASTITGADACPPCSAGQYSNRTGRTRCDDCQTGRFQDLVGQRSCELCETGRYSPQNRSAECLQCAQGFFGSYAGASVCSQCPAGKFQLSLGQSSCGDCPPGRSSLPGALSCAACEGNTAAPLAGTPTPCPPCPALRSQNSDKTACVCGIGTYFGRFGSAGNFTCLNCPTGAVCDELGESTDTLTTAPGYWRSSVNTTEFYECLVDFHCAGGRESNCDDNREGPLCAQCSPNSQLSASGRCISCAGNDDSNIVVFVFVTMILCGGLFAMYYVILFASRHTIAQVNAQYARRVQLFRTSFRDSRRGGFDELAEPLEEGNMKFEGYRPVGKPNMTYKLKIIVSLFQIATNLTFSLDMPWPSAFSNFVSIFSVMNLDYVQWSSVNCVAPVDFFDKLLVVTLVPVVIMVAVTCTYLIPVYYKNSAGMRFFSSESDPYHEARLARKLQRKKFWKLALFTMFLVYPHVSATILRMYVCREVEGKYYLLADFKTRCYESRWNEYVPYSIFAIILYPIGIPLWFLHLLLRYRKRFRSIAVRLQLGFLYDGYQSDSWWFELLDMAHKLTLVSLLSFFPVKVQLPLGMAVVYIYGIFILLWQPYYRKGDDRLALMAQVELFLLILAGYVYQNTDSPSDSDDALMSAFLIIVIVAFVLVFVIQSVHILKKAVATMIKDKEDREQQKQLLHGSSSSPALTADDAAGLPEASRIGSTSFEDDNDNDGLMGPDVVRTSSAPTLVRMDTTAIELANMAKQAHRSEVTAHALMSRNPVFDPHQSQHERDVQSIKPKSRVRALLEDSSSSSSSSSDEDDDNYAIRQAQNNASRRSTMARMSVSQVMRKNTIGDASCLDGPELADAMPSVPVDDEMLAMRNRVPSRTDNFSLSSADIARTRELPGVDAMQIQRDLHKKMKKSNKKKKKKLRQQQRLAAAAVVDQHLVQTAGSGPGSGSSSAAAAAAAVSVGPGLRSADSESDFEAGARQGLAAADDIESIEYAPRSAQLVSPSVSSAAGSRASFHPTSINSHYDDRSAAAASESQSISSRYSVDIDIAEEEEEEEVLE